MPPFLYKLFNVRQTNNYRNQKLNQMVQKTTLYKDTITDLNREYRILVNHYLWGDTRAIYLRKFELILSQNCPGCMLWEIPAYSRISHRWPLPKNIVDYVSRDTFYLYLMLYEKIMREIGLIGQVKEDTPDMKMFDMGVI